MTFFSTIYDLCRGTQVALKLVCVRPFVAIRQMLLLILLCSILVTVVSTAVNRSRISAISAQFFDQTKGILITDHSITTEANPGSVQRYILSNRQLWFDYFPGSTFSSWRFPDSAAGILCLNSGIAFWMKNPSGAGVQALAVPVSQLNRILHDSAYLTSFLYSISKDKKRDLSDEQFIEYIRKTLPDPVDASAVPEANPDAAPVVETPPETESTRSVESAVPEPRSVADATVPGTNSDHKRAPVTRITAQDVDALLYQPLSAITFSFVFMEMILVIPLAGFFFALVQYLRGSSMPRRMRLAPVVSLTVYAMFVPLLIASFFSMIRQPFLSFQMVFLIAFFVSQILLFNRVYRTMNPPRNEGDSSSGGDF